MITVINSWSTGCVPCVEEIPGFNKLVNKYGTKVRFVAVALNKREELQKFLQRKPFGFTHTVANDESVRAFGTTYPRTLIMEENGTIVFDKTGGSVDSYKDIDSELELLLAHKQ